MHGSTETDRRTAPADAVGDNRATHEGSESLLREVGAAAEAAVDHVRKLASTASTEAQLSVLSIAAMAVAALSGFALLLVAWLCLLALGIWLAIQAGWSVTAALVTATAINLLIIGIIAVWMRKLSRNLGFSRTRELIRHQGAGF